LARDPGPARHERPSIDEAALAAARDADHLLAGASQRGAARWAAFFDGVPDRLRDAPLAELRTVAKRVRSAYGPRDSIRDALPGDLTEPLLADLDRLLKLLAREDR
jgi:hypothetical protein